MLKKFFNSMLVCLSVSILACTSAFAEISVKDLFSFDFFQYEEEQVVSHPAISGAVIQTGAANTNAPLGALLTAVSDPVTGDRFVGRIDGGTTRGEASVIILNLPLAGKQTFEFEIMTTSVSDTNISKQVVFGGITIFSIVGTDIKVNGKVVGTMETNHWYKVYELYDIDNSSLTCYIDGKLIGEYNVPIGSQNRTRVGVSNNVAEVSGGELYIASFKQKMVTGSASASIEKEELDSNDEDIVINFDYPVVAESVVEKNISVTSVAGEVPKFKIGKTLNDNGFVTAITIDFEETLITDNEYTIGFNNVTDAAGGVVSNSVSFKTTPPDFEYVWGDVKLYRGMGSEKKESDKFVKGFNSIAIDVANNGVRGRDVTLVVAVYNGDTLVEFQYVTYKLGAFDDAQISTGFILDSVGSDTYAEVMMWRTPDDAEPLMDKVTIK